MRILFCSEQPPLQPLDDGIRLPLHALLGELERRHEVRVVALFQPDLAEKDARNRDLRLVPRPSTGLLRDATLVARAEITGRPLRADSLANRIRPILREEVSSFVPDVVHVVTGQIAGVRDAVQDRPAVLAAQDAWYRNTSALAVGATGFRRLVYRREVDRVRRFEYREYSRYEAVVVVSQDDADALDSLRPGLPLHVIPNGVDAAFFSPDPSTRPIPMNIVFHGALYHAPNEIAARMLAEQILPLVQAELPEASLTIVGRRPLGSIAALDRPDRGIQIAADVDDVRPWLHAGSVYAAPMTTGTGIKNKVLEAMACALPCVVTPRALQGLHVTADHDLLVASDPMEFAAKLVDVLRDPRYARRIGLQGRQYVIRAHDWRAVARQYEDLYHALLKCPTTHS
jgi:polysaccharide biosynthesis protein PslH